MAQKVLGEVALNKLITLIKTLVNTKQDTLTFDNTPTANSTNPVTSGGVKSAIPTKLSDLTNDSGYITSSDIPEGAAASTTTPAMDGTAATGSELAFARGDHVHPTDTSRAASDHTHGNITNGGDITASAPTIANGDQLVINDDSASKITNGPTFDGSTTNKYLSPKGTWENIPSGPSPADATPLMDGSAAVGTSTDYAREDHVHPTDTSRAAVDKIVGSVAFSSDDTTGYVDKRVKAEIKDSQTTPAVLATGYIPQVSSSSAGVAPKGAAVSTQSQSTKFLREDGTWSAPSYSSNTDTLVKQTAKTDNVEYKILATPSASPTSGNAAEAAYDADITINPSTNTITATNFKGTAEKATKDASGNTITTTYAPLASPALTGTPTAPTASSSTNTTQVATTAFVHTAISAAQVGAAMFQGTAPTTFAPTNYKSGYYWVVNTAGTYAGETCEPGDMIFAKADYNSAYSASDFTVIQNNIDMSEYTATEVETLWNSVSVS